MSTSFRLNDDGDGDNGIATGLLLLAAGLSIFDLFFNFLGIVFHVGPLIMFAVTRWFYKKHFRKKLAEAAAATPPPAPHAEV